MIFYNQLIIFSMSKNKTYQIGKKDYMSIVKLDIEKIDIYENHLVNFNERLPYTLNYGITLQSFKLISFKFTLNKDGNVESQEFKAKITALLVVYRKNKVEKMKEKKIDITVSHKKNQSIISVEQQQGGLFTFENIEKDFFEDDKEATAYFEKKIIMLMYAVFKYLLNNPPNNAHLTYKSRLWENVKSKITPELSIMIYNSLNQQFIQNSFKDNTSAGLNSSLSTIEFPTNGLTIHDVDLDSALRISFT
jgi:hypothetical protein